MKVMSQGRIPLAFTLLAKVKMVSNAVARIKTAPTMTSMFPMSISAREKGF